MSKCAPTVIWSDRYSSAVALMNCSWASSFKHAAPLGMDSCVMQYPIPRVVSRRPFSEGQKTYKRIDEGCRAFKKELAWYDWNTQSVCFECQSGNNITRRAGVWSSNQERWNSHKWTCLAFWSCGHNKRIGCKSKADWANDFITQYNTVIEYMIESSFTCCLFIQMLHLLVCVIVGIPPLTLILEQDGIFGLQAKEAVSFKLWKEPLDLQGYNLRQFRQN